jgi:formate/nitrite transporter FocA (FNT family)
MTTPGDVVGSAGGTLILAELAWLWTRNRATRSRDASIRAIYQSRTARIWSLVVCGLLAGASVVALVVAAVIAAT